MQGSRPTDGDAKARRAGVATNLCLDDSKHCLQISLVKESSCIITMLVTQMPAAKPPDALIDPCVSLTVYRFTVE